MKWILIVIATLVALVLVVVAIGYMLPVKHIASGRAHLRQPPAEVFAAITDVKNFPSWRPSVERVEVLPPKGTHAMFREIGSDGTILYETETVERNKRLVNRIADPSLPFGGRWIYDLSPDSGGTLVTITEEGEVYNPVFRFVSRFVIGHTRTIERFLHDLEQRTGAAN